MAGIFSLLPHARFHSVPDPGNREPNTLINLAYAGFALLAVTLVTLGIRLIRKGRQGGPSK